MLALFFFSGIKGQPTRRLCVLTWFCARQVVFKFSCPLSPFDLISINVSLSVCRVSFSLFGLQIVIMPKAKSSHRTSTSTAPTKCSSPRDSVQASSAVVWAVPARTKRSTQVEAIAVASNPAVPTH